MKILEKLLLEITWEVDYVANVPAALEEAIRKHNVVGIWQGIRERWIEIGRQRERDINMRKRMRTEREKITG